MWKISVEFLTKSMSGPNIFRAFSSFLTYVNSPQKLKTLSTFSESGTQASGNQSKWFSTKALTGNPLFLKISTTLLPTPPVAPATSMIPEVPISVTGSSVDPLVSFSNTDETNFTSKKQSN